MLFLGFAASIITAIAIGAGTANAQGSVAPNPVDVVPEKMPFNVPYGVPILAERAQAVIQAASAEAAKRGWPSSIAVVDSGANLVAFLRMYGALLASISVSVKYRRPTKVFEEALQKFDYKYVLTLDDVIALRGGIPLIEDGKLIGAVGCSGATGSQDEVICSTGAAVINK